MRALFVGLFGLVVLLGAGTALGPAPSTEPGSLELASSLWASPLPPFVQVAARDISANARGLLTADPPSLLRAPSSVAAPDKSAPGVAAGLAAGAQAATTSSASAVAKRPDAREAGIPIRVYFSRHPDSDAAFSAVYPVSRSAPDRGVATAALTKLIEGPTPDEHAAGYFSELGRALSGSSVCSGRDFELAIQDGVATVRFCRAVTSAGIGLDARVRSQIEATLGQFSTIRSVRLLGASGHCLFDETGRDRCLSSAASVPRPSAAR